MIHLLLVSYKKINQSFGFKIVIPKNTYIKNPRSLYSWVFIAINQFFSLYFLGVWIVDQRNLDPQINQRASQKRRVQW